MLEQMVLDHCVHCTVEHNQDQRDCWARDECSSNNEMFNQTVINLGSVSSVFLSVVKHSKTDCGLQTTSSLFTMMVISSQKTSTSKRRNQKQQQLAINRSANGWLPSHLKTLTSLANLIGKNFFAQAQRLLCTGQRVHRRHTHQLQTLCATRIEAAQQSG